VDTATSSRIRRGKNIAGILSTEPDLCGGPAIIRGKIRGMASLSPPSISLSYVHHALPKSRSHLFWDAMTEPKHNLNRQQVRV
jgi:hypothetical protein